MTRLVPLVVIAAVAAIEVHDEDHVLRRLKVELLLRLIHFVQAVTS